MIDILLVEDNPGDVELVGEALRRSDVPNRLRSVGDGIDALAYLRNGAADPSAPPPSLILLDLNLPRMDGRELLAEIKRDVALRRIPVVVLTSSEAARDIERSYDLQANGYLVKPVTFAAFMASMRALEQFWLVTARLPSSSPS